MELAPISRRDFVRAAAASLPLAAAFADERAGNGSYVNGVQLGVQTYSFHEILNDGANHADAMIKDMLACGLYVCELFSPQIEPGTFVGKYPPPGECPTPLTGCVSGKGGSQRNPWSWEFRQLTGDELAKARATQKMWRETVSMDYFQGIRKQFEAAGMRVIAYNPMVGADNSDRELDRTFQAAKALGAKSVNVSTTLTMLKRLIPFAEKNQIIVAPHGHSATWDPEHFSTRKTFEDAFSLSKWVGANLDIGHYTAAGEDPAAFLEQFHDRITNLHLKDRRRNRTRDQEDGMNVPWGQGDTPIRQVLQLLRKNRYLIPACIEYEHAGTSDPVAEVKKCYQYCKEALA